MTFAPHRGLGRRLFVAGTLAAAAFGSAHAQGDWPRSQSIRLIVPFTAGSGTDIVARLVAERLGRTPAQVLLRWGLQHGVPQIPKSTKRERIVENGQLFDFELSDEDMGALDALDETDGTAEARADKWWR